jgi:hypothetical protein
MPRSGEDRNGRRSTEDPSIREATVQYTSKNSNVPDRVTRTKIAAFASVDERTVHHFLAGRRHPRPAVKAAIVTAMRSLGLNPPAGV